MSHSLWSIILTGELLELPLPLKLQLILIRPYLDDLLDFPTNMDIEYTKT